MQRILTIGVTFVLWLLCTVPAMAKPWTLKETNLGDRVLAVFVQWTKNGVTFAAEPVADLAPGESVKFKPPEGATDWVQTRFFRSGDPEKDTVKGLVLKISNSFEVGDIADVVDPFPVGTEFLIPDPVLPGIELFVGVDLATYLPLALSSIPLSLDIINGTSPFLPGYLVGTTEVNFDSSLGLSTDNPFTGTVIFNSTHAIIVVPEPSAGILFVTGLVSLVVFGWRRRSRAGCASMRTRCLQGCTTCA